MNSTNVALMFCAEIKNIKGFLIDTKHNIDIRYSPNSIQFSNFSLIIIRTKLCIIEIRKNILLKWIGNLTQNEIVTHAQNKTRLSSGFLTKK